METWSYKIRILIPTFLTNKYKKSYLLSDKIADTFVTHSILEQTCKEVILIWSYWCYTYHTLGHVALGGSICFPNPACFRGIQEGWESSILETRGNRELSDVTFLWFLGFTLFLQEPQNIFTLQLPNTFFFLRYTAWYVNEYQIN